MTDRPYYDDAYTTDFEATVLETFTHEGHPAVRLDRSFFYPTSGGQPHDLGTLDGVAVTNVTVGSRGEVIHTLAEPLSKAMRVLGKIDWPRRYDHMQQHAGQHLLSQLFYQTLGLETVSVHFGDSLNTLDLEGESLTANDLHAIEEKANALIWHNRPIRAYWVTDADLPRIPLRRPPKVSGAIRIVEIDSFDWSACGGTHVRQTSEIGLLSLVRVEKMRRQSRVYFVCGGRALRDYQQRRAVLATTAALVDAAFEDVPGLVEKLQAHNKELDRTLRALQAELLTHRATALLAAARFVGGVRLIAQVQHDLDASALKGLAQTLQAQPRVVALLCCESGDKGTAIFARSEGLDLNMGQLLREVLREVGGSGGGRPDFAQGGGMAAQTLDDVLNRAVSRLVELLPPAPTWSDVEK